jgi:DNA-directed RNA polymerase specialized sigma24 family protein
MAKVDHDTPDEVLVVAAMLGDLGAFETLALRYRPGVVRAAQAIVGRDDAEDVAQDSSTCTFARSPLLLQRLRPRVDPWAPGAACC